VIRLLLQLMILCSMVSIFPGFAVSIEVADLALTDVDPLARTLRKLLRRDYGFPKDVDFFGIPAVFSKEEPTHPRKLSYDSDPEIRRICSRDDDPYFTTRRQKVIMGTAPFVTAAFGLQCASVAVRSLIARPGDK